MVYIEVPLQKSLSIRKFAPNFDLDMRANFILHREREFSPPLNHFQMDET